MGTLAKHQRAVRALQNLRVEDHTHLFIHTRKEGRPRLIQRVTRTESPRSLQGAVLVGPVVSLQDEGIGRLNIQTLGGKGIPGHPDQRSQGLWLTSQQAEQHGVCTDGYLTQLKTSYHSVSLHV
jgi:hypothetical protein